MSASAALVVDRGQVLAYRVAAQQLDRPGVAAADLAVFDLGVQDSPWGSATQSVAARIPANAGSGAAARGHVDLSDGKRWVTAWAIRGAPHVFRKGDVRAMATATWPASPEDAAARLVGYGAGLRKRGEDALAALRVAAEGLRDVVKERMVKGDASGAVTKTIPELCSEPCRACGVVHISDQLMRLAGLPACLTLVPGTTPVELRPIPRWPGVPTRPQGATTLVEAYLRLHGPATAKEVAAYLTTLVEAYLRLHGPATAKEVAAYLQTTRAIVKQTWPEGVVEVEVDGRRAWLPEDRVDALRDAPPAVLVRLLPRSDPWLLARDRELLVPEAAARKVLWPVLGFPGGVLIDGEVAGIWRTKAAGRRLDLSVQPFGRVPKGARQAIEDEAARVAALRGHDDGRVTYDER